MRKGIIAALISVGIISQLQAHTLVQLSDQQLSDTVGQALMSLAYLAPSDTANLMTKYSNGSNMGFYKLGLEAEMDLNANIRNLQLGCGGVNGAGSCDVDIKNLSLSGLPAGYNAASGSSPDYGLTDRASTSAKLTNPFMEFAVKNPDKAATREIVGLRFSAEKITGLLSAGIANGMLPSSTDGIQSLSGFMRIAATTGEVDTLPTLFGKQADHQIKGLLSALGNDREFTSEPGSSDTNGVTVPSMKAGFTMPGFQVNGRRMTNAHVEHVKATIGQISLSDGPSNQLKVNFDAIALVATSSKIKLATGSMIKNLNMDITFDQALSMFHNIPLVGTGGYLSLQQQALLWPGSYVDPSDMGAKNLSEMLQTDVAQQGWWMSFAEPVQLGYLKASDKVDVSNVLPQVATLMTNELLKEENRVYVPAGSALGSIFGMTLTTPQPIVVDLGAATLKNPATLTLSNIKLANQNPTANCYGSLKFC
ncbi:hypothetical protein [Acinetobacter silvestris]|uniref:Uncharacterized protein n=1 Tax=Acinetobacter silvestris TaxID=1977882 RepID=A0A1Y3CI73_9GAMM|nr:hypothetical protein [Acinetobacter silvestris]OTG65592.1 hypothetical protein B9T28_09085 [Acinetobacter silvestris]